MVVGFSFARSSFSFLEVLEPWQYCVQRQEMSSEKCHKVVKSNNVRSPLIEPVNQWWRWVEPEERSWNSSTGRVCISTWSTCRNIGRLCWEMKFLTNECLWGQWNATNIYNYWVWRLEWIWTSFTIGVRDKIWCKFDLVCKTRYGLQTVFWVLQCA